jgi:hypothetical protein
MLVSYPPNLESAAAPATASATSSWPRSGCAMVSRPTALVRRSSPTNSAGLDVMAAAVVAAFGQDVADAGGALFAETDLL